MACLHEFLKSYPNNPLHRIIHPIIPTNPPFLQIRKIDIMPLKSYLPKVVFRPKTTPKSTTVPIYTPLSTTNVHLEEVVTLNVHLLARTGHHLTRKFSNHYRLQIFLTTTDNTHHIITTPQDPRIHESPSA